jgi:aromatic-L-amino-acid/L-tryptophan decarboxylase
VAFVTPSSWEGETVGRLVFMHPATTVGMVREVLDATA